MQDQYAGDIGDYGKFGFLQVLEGTGLSIGINWYYTGLEASKQKQQDGRYRIAQKYFECAPKLATMLYEISVQEGIGRSVKALEQARLLKTALYYRNPVGQKGYRSLWHKAALERLESADVVFLDPDNGLLAKSVGRNSKKSVKYVFEDEILSYLLRGQAVVFYHHRPRQQAKLYFSEMSDRINAFSRECYPQIMSLTFPRHSVRDYFVICPDGRCAVQIRKAAEFMLNSTWGQKGIVTQFQDMNSARQRPCQNQLIFV